MSRKFNVVLYSDRGFEIDNWAGVETIEPFVLPGMSNVFKILDKDEEGILRIKALVCGGIIVAKRRDE